MVSRIEETIQNRDASRTEKLKRFFSIESSGSSFRYPMNYWSQSDDDSRENLCGYELFLKLAELFVSAICIGLYSTGIVIVPCDTTKTKTGEFESRFTSIMFPNIVFSAFMIINSVIVLSYALRQLMSDVVVRMFNAIGMILYFVSGCLTGYIWYTLSDKEIKQDLLAAYRMFCAHVVISFLNSILYGVDVALSIRRAWNINAIKL